MASTDSTSAMTTMAAVVRGFNVGRQPRQVVDLGVEQRACWSSRRRTGGSRRCSSRRRCRGRAPASVPTTPMLAPVMRNTRMMAPLLAPMVRRMPTSRPLSFTSIIRPEMMLKRGDQDDQRQDDEHHVALDLEHGEEALVALPPVGETVGCGCPPAFMSASTGRHVLGVVDDHLEHVDRVARAK